MSINNINKLSTWGERGREGGRERGREGGRERGRERERERDRETERGRVDIYGHDVRPTKSYIITEYFCDAVHVHSNKSKHQN